MPCVFPAPWLFPFSDTFHTLFHTSIRGRQRAEKQRQKYSHTHTHTGQYKRQEVCVEGSGRESGLQNNSYRNTASLVVFPLPSSRNFKAPIINKPRPNSNQAIFLCNRKINQNLLQQLQSGAMLQYDCLGRN